MRRVRKGNSCPWLSELRGCLACYPLAVLLFVIFLSSLCEAQSPLDYECDDYRELIERLPSCSLRGRCFRHANYSTGCICSRGYSGDGVSCDRFICPTPTFPARPVHGVVLDDPSKVYAPPDNARLGCESGYHIVGGEFIRCGWFGEWAAAQQGPNGTQVFPTCEDTDECASGLEVCTTVSLDGAVDAGHSGVQFCKNTPGSFICVCKRGYANFNNTVCREQTPCPQYASVANGQSFQQDTSFEGDMRVVVCNNGYYSKPGTSSICLASSSWSQVECRDIDECASGLELCTTLSLDGAADAANSGVQSCKNTRGSFTCTCKQGYDNLNSTACQDIDECASGLELCTTLSLDGAADAANSGVQSCKNTRGSFTCTCKQGYDNLNSTACQGFEEDEQLSLYVLVVSIVPLVAIVLAAVTVCVYQSGRDKQPLGNDHIQCIAARAHGSMEALYADIGPENMNAATSSLALVPENVLDNDSLDIIYQEIDDLQTPTGEMLSSASAVDSESFREVTRMNYGRFSVSQQEQSTGLVYINPLAKRFSYAYG